MSSSLVVVTGKFVMRECTTCTKSLSISEVEISGKYALDNVSAIYKYFPGTHFIFKSYSCKRSMSRWSLGSVLFNGFFQMYSSGL